EINASKDEHTISYRSRARPHDNEGLTAREVQAFSCSEIRKLAWRTPLGQFSTFVAEAGHTKTVLGQALFGFYGVVLFKVFRHHLHLRVEHLQAFINRHSLRLTKSSELLLCGRLQLVGDLIKRN